MIFSRRGAVATALTSVLVLIPTTATLADDHGRNDSHANSNSTSNSGSGSHANANANSNATTNPSSSSGSGSGSGSGSHANANANSNANSNSNSHSNSNSGSDKKESEKKSPESKAQAPNVTTMQATLVTSAGATLHGKVRPRGSATTYGFQYGVTKAYGKVTPLGSAGNGEDFVAVAKAVTGLAPGTTYHFRLVATTAGGVTAGQDRTFTTNAADGTRVNRGHGATSEPTLGETVGVEAEGAVRVLRPGATTFTTIAPGDTVPTGTVIDARFGTVTLTTAVTPNTTQQGTFWGGAFEVRQSPTGGGYTDLYLRGFPPLDCSASPVVGLRTAKASARRRGRSLWGRDSGGRFRTHGRNSVATVRGTNWFTEERCGGTLTYVREGVVVVRTASGRIVTLRAGKGYLARPYFARPLGLPVLAARRLG